MSSNLKVASLTLFVAFMLTIMPLPEWAIEFRPDWVTLVLVYWAMALPARVGVTIAWFAGLMLDVSQYGFQGRKVSVCISQHGQSHHASLLSNVPR